VRGDIPGILGSLRRLPSQRNHALAIGLAVRDLFGLLS